VLRTARSGHSSEFILSLEPCSRFASLSRRVTWALSMRPATD